MCRVGYQMKFQTTPQNNLNKKIVKKLKPDYEKNRKVRKRDNLYISI